MRPALSSPVRPANCSRRPLSGAARHLRPGQILVCRSGFASALVRGLRLAVGAGVRQARSEVGEDLVAIEGAEASMSGVPLGADKEKAFTGQIGRTLAVRLGMDRALVKSKKSFHLLGPLFFRTHARQRTFCSAPSFRSERSELMGRHIEAADLPEDIARIAEAQVSARRFATVEDVVRAGVEAIAIVEQKRDAIRAALEEGEASGAFEGDAFASVRAELGLNRQ